MILIDIGIACKFFVLPRAPIAWLWRIKDKGIEEAKVRDRQERKKSFKGRVQKAHRQEAH